MRKKITPFRANLFFFLKLPAAWLTGVRVDKIDDNSATVRLKHMWVNQNPFDSIFWAVQGMAAEISTSELVECTKPSRIHCSLKAIPILPANSFGRPARKKQS